MKQQNNSQKIFKRMENEQNHMQHGFASVSTPYDLPTATQIYIVQRQSTDETAGVQQYSTTVRRRAQRQL